MLNITSLISPLKKDRKWCEWVRLIKHMNALYSSRNRSKSPARWLIPFKKKFYCLYDFICLKDRLSKNKIKIRIALDFLRKNSIIFGKKLILNIFHFTIDQYIIQSNVYKYFTNHHWVSVTGNYKTIVLWLATAICY